MLLFECHMRNINYIISINQIINLQLTIRNFYYTAYTTEMKMSYPHIVNQHLIKANWAQAALHYVCNRTCCHN